MSLSALALSGVDIGSFDSDTLAYTASVAHATAQTTVTATPVDSTATVTIDPNDADPDTDGHQITLSEGSNTITLTVTTPGGTSQTYTVEIERDAASAQQNVQADDSDSSVSEAPGTDLPNETTTLGKVAVGDSVTGVIEPAGDQDWFAVELEAEVEYQIDLEGSATERGTLADPLLRWLHDADRVGISGTRDDNGGEGANARQVFTPDADGTYYISANGVGTGTGSYTLTVTQTNPSPVLPDSGPDDDPQAATPPPILPASMHVEVEDLGVLTPEDGVTVLEDTLNGAGAQEFAYYSFTLEEALVVILGLHQLDYDGRPVPGG